MTYASKQSCFLRKYISNFHCSQCGIESQMWQPVCAAAAAVAGAALAASDAVAPIDGPYLVARLPSHGSLGTN